jgi:hypothetical protein
LFIAIRAFGELGRHTRATRSGIIFDRYLRALPPPATTTALSVGVDVVPVALRDKVRAQLDSKAAGAASLFDAVAAACLSHLDAIFHSFR